LIYINIHVVNGSKRKLDQCWLGLVRKHIVISIPHNRLRGKRLIRLGSVLKSKSLPNKVWIDLICIKESDSLFLRNFRRRYDIHDVIANGNMRMLQFTQVHSPSQAYARARSLSQDLSDSTWPPTPRPERL
jgi:hypothetical protein